MSILIFLNVFWISCTHTKHHFQTKPTLSSEPPQLSQSPVPSSVPQQETSLLIAAVMQAFSENQCDRVNVLSQSIPHWQQMTPLDFCQKWGETTCVAVTVCQAIRSKQNENYQILALNTLDFLIRKKPYPVWLGGGPWYLHYLKSEVLGSDSPEKNMELQKSKQLLREQARYFQVESERQGLISQIGGRKQISDECSQALQKFLKNFSHTRQNLPHFPYQTFKQLCSSSEEDKFFLDQVKKSYISWFIQGQLLEASAQFLHTQSTEQRHLMQDILIKRQPTGSLQQNLMKDWLKSLTIAHEGGHSFIDMTPENPFIESPGETLPLESPSLDSIVEGSQPPQESISNWYEEAKKLFDQEEYGKVLVLLKPHQTQDNLALKNLYQDALAGYVRHIRIQVSQLKEKSQETKEPQEQIVFLEKALDILKNLFREYPEVQKQHPQILLTAKYLETNLNHLKEHYKPEGTKKGKRK